MPMHDWTGNCVKGKLQGSGRKSSVSTCEHFRQGPRCSNAARMQLDSDYTHLRGSSQRSARRWGVD